MTCFWTDLVGATQVCPEASAGRKLVVNTTVMRQAAPAALADIATSFATAFNGLNPSFSEAPYHIDELLGQFEVQGAGYAHASEAEKAIYENVAYSFVDSVSAYISVGFTDANTRFTGSYAEFAAGNQPLTVAGAWYVTYNSCGQPLAGVSVTPLSTAGATAQIDSNGVLDILCPTDFGTPPAALIYTRVLRITGTILGENGASVDADFYVTGSTNVCV